MSTKYFLIFLILLSISYSDVIAPNLISQDDHLDPHLPSFVFSFSIDCNRSTGTFYVFDSNLTPIQNVSSYLSYIDYSTPLLSKSFSDSNGKITHSLIGKTIYMRGMFVWYFVKDGYRPKEVHFDIRKCYENQSVIPLPIYTPKPIFTIPNSNQTISSEPVLMSEPKYWTNTTPNPDSSKTTLAQPCPFSLFVLSFISTFAIGLKIR